MTDGFKPDIGTRNHFSCSFNSFVVVLVALTTVHPGLHPTQNALSLPLCSLWTSFSVVSVETVCGNRPEIIPPHVMHCVIFILLLCCRNTGT